MLLHTDGLIERRNRSLDQGMDQAARIAARHADQPLPQLCDALLNGFTDTIEDDVALQAARLRT